MPALIVFVTAPNRDEADRLSQALVEEKLAACVSVVPEIHSRYWWQGKIETGSEVLLIIKTMSDKFSALSKRIAALHSYSVPEILAIPIVKGSASYLKWMKDALRKRKPAKK